ncbi:putative lipopolysaccharide heptosyltransferase III [Rouxiella sp. WC2420]
MVNLFIIILNFIIKGFFIRENTSMRPLSTPSACKKKVCSTDSNLPLQLSFREKVLHILVIKLRHYGDVLLTTPLLSTLRINYPHAVIEMLVYGDTHTIIKGYPYVGNVYTVDRTLKNKGGRAQYLGEKDLWKRLHSTHYDMIINLSDQWRAALYCRALRPTYSLGFRFPKRNHRLWQACHTRLVDMNGHQQQHTVLNNLSILAPLDLPTRVTKVTQSYQQCDIDEAQKLIERHQLTDYVLLQPTARWAFKTWSVANFTEIVNHLTATGRTVVLCSGRLTSEISVVDAIQANCNLPQKVINLAGELELSTLAVIIERATLFIGVDSAPMHMAAALQTPCVVLFGPSNLAQWSPWQVKHTLLWAGDYRILPTPEEVNTNTEERYLDAISVIDVIQAIDQQLNNLMPTL